MKVNATKQEMRTAVELLLDINRSMKHFPYNRSPTASPLCPCKETEETATHFYSTVQYMELQTAKNVNLYDLRDGVNLVEFIRTSGRDVSSNHLTSYYCQV